MDRKLKKIQLFYLSITILFILFIVGIAFIYSINTIDKRKQELVSELRVVAAELEAQNLEYERKVLNLSNVAESFVRYHRTSVHRQEPFDSLFMSYIMSVVKKSANTYGAGVWFEPYIIDKFKFYGPYAYWSAWKLTPTWSYSSEEYNFHIQNWYAESIKFFRNKRNQIYWTNPYLDTGETKELMITVSSPILYDTTLIGISTQDISMKFLYNWLRKRNVNKSEKSFLYFIKNGHIISLSFDSTNKFTQIRQIDWLDKFNNIITNEPIKSESINIMVEGESHEIFFKQIYPNLIFGIAISNKELMKPIVKMAVPMSLISITFIILLIISHWITIRRITNLSKNVEGLNQYLQSLSDSLPDLTLVIDHNANIIDTNRIARDFFDKPLKDDNLNNFISKINDDFDFYEAIAKVILAGEIKFIAEIRNSKGQHFIGLSKLKKIYIDNKEMLLLVITDITELKQREDEINRLNKNFEALVEERTARLQSVMKDLQLQIEEKIGIENHLKMTNDELLQMNETIANDANNLLILKDELLESKTMLEEANRTKEKFLSLIAHDLKNPVHAALLSSDLIVANFDKMNLQLINDANNNINRSLKHLYKLLDNLLLWSRTQSKRIDFNPIEFSLSKIINNNIMLIKQFADKKNITFELLVGEDIKAYADENMISTVIRNLLSNAVKYSYNGGVIQISADMNPNEVTITIKDYGVGMKKQVLEDLFKIEKSQSTPGTNNEKGTGFGLIISKEFIDMHQGKIIIDSYPGEGSKFTIILPCRTSDLSF